MTPLVGRDRELSAVAARFDAVAAGRGSAVVVSGEPGIGKTRFLEPCATLAAERGFATAWGRAWEVGSAPPYWPWIEALRALAARPELHDLGDERARAVPEPMPPAPTAPAPTDRTIRLAQEGELWTVTGVGELCRIKDSKSRAAQRAASP